jgi:lipase
MKLFTRSWGNPQPEAVVCIHGVTQFGGVFEQLAGRLVLEDQFVVAVDLRGHGASDFAPPWDTQAHVADIAETLNDLGVRRAAWVGHSFGGRIAAVLADTADIETTRVVLLDPAFELPPDYVLKAAEIDRQDWSFSSTEGAINALLSSPSVVTEPRAEIAAYTRSHLEGGSDGLLRFRYCPSAAVVLWNEAALPGPDIAQLPTLLIRPVSSFVDGRAQDLRYRQALGPLLSVVAVPNGHNMLWEAREETNQAVSRFLQN